MGTSVKCDLHIHSQFSDGKLTISEIVDIYGRRGFGAIAITDHLCEQKNIIGRFSHKMNFSLSSANFAKYMEEIQIQGERALSEYGMLVIPGYEITKNSFANHRSAHILILGTQKYIEPELSVDEILAKAKNIGAFTVAAHPFHTGALEFQTFHLWSRREQLRHLIDAWEVNSRKVISQEVLTSGLPLIANSDFHHPGHLQSWKTKVYSAQNQTGIFASIKNQNLDFFLDCAT
jgi:predicted metal-dependent phosphoesterase TrpH